MLVKSVLNAACLSQSIAFLHARLFNTAAVSCSGTNGRRKLRVRRGENPWVGPRAIPFGVNRAYDQALVLINQDSEKLRKELKSLVAPLRRAREAGDSELAQQLTSKMHILNIQSKINLPQVRWRFLRGMADMSRAVYRHLAEQKWRNDGALDLCMERIYQMHVVPDILPGIHPTLDLRVMFDQPPPNSLYLRTRAKRQKQGVVPGSFLLPEQTRNPPKLFVTPFHPESRYYTLVMVDLDAPHAESQSFHTYLHWLIPNIEVNSTTALLQVERENYEPPHPEQGTPYHRYTLLLLQNPEGKRVPINTTAEIASRDSFDVRRFCDQYGFDFSLQGQGGGVFMWRELWSEVVSDIYKSTLGKEEPKYGKMPRFDLYGEVNEMRRYR